MSLINREDLMLTLGITDSDCEKCGWYNKATERCKRGSDFEDACCAIEDAPTIEPVRKGHWDNVDETPYIRKHFNVVCCSVCRKKGYTAWNYCPNCGAKMKEGD